MRPVRPADAAFAALLLTTGLLEAAFSDVGSAQPVGTTVGSLLVAAAMLLRTGRPLVCLAVTASLVVAAHVPSTGLPLTAALVVGALLALASVGRRCGDAASVAGVLVTVTVFVVGSAFSERPWDVLIALIGCGAAWGAGRLLLREAVRNDELSSLAADLAAERDVRAAEAVHAERLRMARELHDTLAHTVSVMTLQVGGVRRRLEADPSTREEREVLLGVEGLGRESVAELQRLLGVLRAPGDTDPDESMRPQPRLADLEQLAARVRAAGVDVDLRVEGAVRPLPAGLELAGYRVVQEALTNVLKHSPGGTASVQVAYTPDRLELSVQDDGRRTEVGPSGTGLGLVGIRERVAMYGGRLESGPNDRGFRVWATLPIAVTGS